MQKQIKFKAKIHKVNNSFYITVPRPFLNNRILDAKKQYWYSISAKYNENTLKLRFTTKFMMSNNCYFIVIPQAYFNNKLLNQQKMYWYTVEEEKNDK